MDYESFSHLVDDFIDQLRKIEETKGVEYANHPTDRLANFKRRGQEVGVTPETVAMVYAGKHFDAVCHFVKGLEGGESYKDLKAKLTEDIRGRMVDIANYMILLSALVAEREERDG